jgi:hypothetical protein
MRIIESSGRVVEDHIIDGVFIQPGPEKDISQEQRHDTGLEPSTVS